ncbi:MAG: membrane dipeptidase [Myxococcota bacterium]
MFQNPKRGSDRAGLPLSLPTLPVAFGCALALALALLAPPASAGNRVASCGGLNQVPCNIFQAIPSCDTTIPWLYENFSVNRCLALGCGGEGQAPCTITQHIPSCNPGLFEIPFGVRCTAIDAQGFPTFCGDAGERACTVIEHIPSCKSGLIENFDDGFCYAFDGDGYPTYCGDPGEEACTVVEHIPSCKPNAVENLAEGLCYGLDGNGYPTYCGDQYEQACTVDIQTLLGITSCKPGLLEDIGTGTCYGFDADGYPEFCGDLNESACAATLQGAYAITSCKPGLYEEFGLPFGTCRYTPVPEPGLATTATIAPSPGEPIFGMADLHSHAFANLGFGGRLFHGKAHSPYGVAGALPECTLAHGPGGLTDLVGNELNQSSGHDNAGYPNFVDWPSREQAHHQQMYHRWLERAYRGGLRLLVVHAVNNEVLCSVSLQREGYGCADMPSVDRQIDAAWALKTAIDAAAGGPGQGWLDIALSAAHARQILESGKLAIVLGIEVDALFGCKPGQCSAGNVTAGLDAYHARGVRHVFPVHLFQNDFGAPAIYNSLFDVGSYLSTGQRYPTRDCASEGYGFQLDTSSIASWLTIFGISFPPGAPHDADCNVGGLSARGAELVQGLMQRKMIIDVDHMSARMVEDVLALVEPAAYPVVAGHTGFLETSLGAKRSEGQHTRDHTQRIRDLGGLVAPILEQGRASEIDYVPGHYRVANDCDLSSKSWAQAYLYASDATRGSGFLHAVGLGSDLNGFIHLPTARFGPNACGGNAAQAAQQSPASQIAYPFAAHGDGATGSFSVLSTGTKSWDYNQTGFAHVGLLPDFVEDLKQAGLSDRQLDPLFRSAEAYVAMWERIDRGPECADGIDNDGDGLVDLGDAGCAGPADVSERSAAIVCDDGTDNDDDGLLDAEDPECANPATGAETTLPEPGLGVGLAVGFALLLRRAEAGRRGARGLAREAR